jgi:6-pyruvoyltetrahydropterin/6-carboxytetrahydropterin synthase
MTKIRVTKRFNWEMSHALFNYDGLCRNIHGHSYIMYATIIGEPIVDENNCKLGMVIDFGDFKTIVKETIVNKFDHSLVLYKKEKHQEFSKTEGLFDRLHILDYQPTCENMVIDFADRISKKLPKEIKLFSLKLYETATSFAEWYSDDQQ